MCFVIGKFMSLIVVENKIFMIKVLTVTNTVVLVFRANFRLDFENQLFFLHIIVSKINY